MNFPQFNQPLTKTNFPTNKAESICTLKYLIRGSKNEFPFRTRW